MKDGRKKRKQTAADVPVSSKPKMVAKCRRRL